MKKARDHITEDWRQKAEIRGQKAEGRGLNSKITQDACRYHGRFNQM